MVKITEMNGNIDTNDYFISKVHGKRYNELIKRVDCPFSITDTVVFAIAGLKKLYDIVDEIYDFTTSSFIEEGFKKLTDIEKAILNLSDKLDMTDYNNLMKMDLKSNEWYVAHMVISLAQDKKIIRERAS